MSDTIQLRGGTYSILLARNIVYAEREMVLELDTGRWKVGDGSTAYADLPYRLIDFIMNHADVKYAPLAPRVTERTSVSSTLSVNADFADGATLSAQAHDFYVNPPSGTPHQQQALRYRFKDDGTARAISWDPIFRELGDALPVTTVAGKVVYVDVVWNADDSVWDVLCVAQQP